MTLREVNPYAAPRSVERGLGDPRQAALNRLGGPSIGLLWLSVLWIGAGLLGLILSVTCELGKTQHKIGDEALLLLISTGLPSWFIAYGAYSMRYGVRYRSAKIAVVAACVPIISPWLLLGIPFGAWALIVLRQPSVQSAFKTNDQMFTASGRLKNDADLVLVDKTPLPPAVSPDTPHREL